MPEDNSLKPSDDPEFFEREAEAKWAKENHRLTKVLGWFLISGVILSIIGIFTGSQHDLGGILFLIAGISILGGSQGWLKFVTFICCLATVMGFADIIWTVAHGEPFSEDKGNSWISIDSLAFWRDIIAPLGYSAAISTLGVACIRTRRIVYWTRTARIWAGIFVGIITIQFLVLFAKWGGREDEIRAQFENEITLICSYVDTHGTFSHPGTFGPVEAALSANPAILKASVKGSPNSTLRLYCRQDPTEFPEGHAPVTYTEFLKTSSG